MPTHKNELPVEVILNQLIDKLHSSGGLQVWSLIITLFGDAIVPKGKMIGTTSLQNILGCVKVEPNAVRTALSRLAKDGWLARHKTGRTSNYSLGPGGGDLFESASRRIYAPGPPKWKGKLELLILPKNSSIDREQIKQSAERLGYGSPINGLLVRPITERSDFLEAEGVIRIEATDLAPEIREALGSGSWNLKPIANLYLEFLKHFSPLHNSLAEFDRLPGEKHMAARMLLIHQWRRIVLRDPGLPADFLPEDWPGTRALDLVRDVYQAVHEKSEVWIAEHCISPEGEIIPKSSEISRRFQS